MDSRTWKNSLPATRSRRSSSSTPLVSSRAERKTGSIWNHSSCTCSHWWIVSLTPTRARRNSPRADAIGFAKLTNVEGRRGFFPPAEDVDVDDNGEESTVTMPKSTESHSTIMRSSRRASASSLLAPTLTTWYLAMSLFRSRAINLRSVVPAFGAIGSSFDGSSEPASTALTERAAASSPDRPRRRRT